ncbi:MAG: tripartite tricarboxylate transporter substrate binding protein [Burkholderiaceae bacterium]|nr:tripartite tricarboxylate transporter substrate binding protein [Burkholderiaceae bacterium]
MIKTASRFKQPLLFAMLGLALLAPWKIAAADPVTEFPNRPLRLVVPFLAGGAVDAGARAVALELSQELGQQVVVENRAGAGGNLGTGLVAKGPNDGYSLLVGAGATITISPAVYRNLSFSAPNDLEPIGPYGALPNLLIVSSASPVGNIQELIANLKRKGASGNFASGGVGSTSHIQGEILKRELGLGMIHIPFQSEPPALISLAQNNVDMMFSALSTAIPQLQANKAKPIAVAAPARLALLPNIPTFKELGINGLEFGVWYGIFVPKSTDPAIVKKLSEALRKTVAKPELKRRLAQVHVEPLERPLDEFKQFIRTEAARMKSVVDAVGAYQN